MSHTQRLFRASITDRGSEGRTCRKQSYQAGNCIAASKCNTYRPNTLDHRAGLLLGSYLPSFSIRPAVAPLSLLLNHQVGEDSLTTGGLRSPLESCGLRESDCHHVEQRFPSRPSWNCELSGLVNPACGTLLIASRRVGRYDGQIEPFGTWTFPGTVSAVCSQAERRLSNTRA